ncbi:HAD family hydrolase [Aliidiomarina minuta]|uniref:HAD family hydrolase n=1 Tax=Aliidiomarina minuta TaxID=880057 RepID=A0A432W6D0_9GAMM|nr:HAD-IA family hydrolase [Aliidiomarina minuta]RUO25633.1 HAD family hydrolase [Aliidiomarina minuta]
MRYDLIIFDWDGTVMDSIPRIVSSLQSTAAACRLKIPSMAEIHDIVGLSLPVAVQMLFDCHEEQEQQQIIAVYRDFYVEKDTTPSPLFAGAETVLQSLKAQGYQLAVATGKARPGLERAWLATNTGHYFSASRCAQEVPSKPDPAMLREILELTQVKAERALMIGDSIHDLNMAANAGVDSLGVTYGVHDAQRLQAAAPRHLINAITELPLWLQGTDALVTE